MFTVLTHLKQLELSGNIINPQDKKQFIENISYLNVLETLSLAEMSLTSKDVYELFICISSIDSIQSINLSCIYYYLYIIKIVNPLKYEKELDIFELISNIPQLKMIKVSDCELNDDYAISLIKNLESSHIEEIDLSNNKLTDKFIINTIESIESFNDLSNFSISGNKEISSKSVVQLFESLLASNNIEVLGIDDIHIEKDDIDKISEYMNDMVNLAVLNCKGINLFHYY